MWLLVVCAALLAHTVSSESEMVKSETCASKYQALDPNHTMCVKDGAQSGERVILGKAWRDRIISEHNEIRGQVNPPAANMQKLKWDYRLAEVAAKWAVQCKLEHDSGSARQIPEYPGVLVGQNWAAGYKNFSAAVSGWHSEKSRWRYAVSYKSSFGHYFQQIFDRATLIGCGMAKCDTKWVNFYVCNYASASITSGIPYKRGSKPCEDCPHSCSRKLCDCGGKVCLNKGKLDVDTCQCQCEPSWKGEKCQSKDCRATDSSWCRLGKTDCSNQWYINRCPHTCRLCGN